ncbi:hypothetical protein EDD29_0539 [Actinocorallia herbida]|uniref:Uncharacterized protein n=1 Tax=Actinocorallia herbida TaxID=58109 RepID=A0A3N1CP08_9ACTN|nr:hypothetical protein [Actinocorallia herbida]ROO83050.1 hypothetical protein EDD29_0539 [Actinocorallia herbida]
MTTMSTLCAARGRAHRRAEPPVRRPRPADGPDHNLLMLLIADREVRTGRTLPPGPCEDLTEEQLIAFWADPHLEPDAATR